MEHMLWTLRAGRRQTCPVKCEVDAKLKPLQVEWARIWADQMENTDLS